MHRTLRRALAASCTAALVAIPLVARAAPVCTTPATQPACGNRVVAEPELTTTFLQYDAPQEKLGDTLHAIEAIAPGFVEVYTADGLLQTPGYVSAGGRKIWLVRITDESVDPAAKKQVAISLSVHGVEPAGREGGVRYIEDLARGAIASPSPLMYAGDVSKPMSEVLDQTEVWVGFLNPDGWSHGDTSAAETDGPGFVRENDNGADLNRDFQTIGWVHHADGRNAELDQKESQAWTALLKSFPNLTTASDIHGELKSTNKAFADLMWPAAQWNPRRQAQELQLAKHMVRTIERKFDQYGVVLGDLFGPTIDQQPARPATGYDAVGYDDSGFMGDAMAQMDVVEIDVENFLSHQAPDNAWSAAIEQPHVAAVRGIMEAVIVEALLTDQVQPDLHLGKVAYVVDPKTVSSSDADGTQAPLIAGETQQPYNVTRMKYFDDLGAASGTPLAAIKSADVATADLSAYDTIVLADTELPVDPDGRPVNATAYTAALKRFAEGGGQLVLTDRAVGLVDDLGVVAASAVPAAPTKAQAGHVDFTTTDPYGFKTGLYGVPSQTYYEVALGFPATTQAPNYGVTTTAWNAAGGSTTGTVGSNTVLGAVPLGAGRVSIFGAILPTQVEKIGTTVTPHPNGLADYAVTIAGGQVLHNMLSYQRNAAEPVVPEAPGSAALLLIGAASVLGAAYVLRRRRMPDAA